MNQLAREERMTEQNDHEPATGWVRSIYKPRSDGRWAWWYRNDVRTFPDAITYAPHRSATRLVLVRQFPHRLNDIVELPIWPSR